MKRIVVASGAALAALGLLLVGLARSPGAGESPAAGAESRAALLPVATLEVRRSGAYAVEERYAGRVVARRESALGFERAGRLDTLHVDEGAHVDAGQVLAELDTRALEARRRELAASVREIEARATLAHLTTERRRRLRASDHVAAQTFDEAVYAERALEAQLAAARAGLARVDVELDLSVLRAPYAGSVVARDVDEGSVVQPGTPILHVIEDGALEVRIGLSPETAAALEIGSRHPVEADGRRFDAELVALLADIDPETRTVAAIFETDPPPADVRHGALARVSISRDVEGDGFWLPIEALSEGRRGLWTAYAVVETDDGQERLTRRQLEVIHTEADRVYVRGTLRDGDRLVASGLHRLVPGQLVRSVDAAVASGRS